MQQPKATDWVHWFFLHRNDTPQLQKADVALKLGLTPAQFSQRLKPTRYNPPVSDEEVRLTAEMWNQPESYVRKVFPRKVAA